MTDTLYCRHGSFIGGPCGPDYLCAWCETGVSDLAYAWSIRRDAVLRAQRDRGIFMAEMVDRMPEIMAGKPYSAVLATSLTDMVETSEVEILAALDRLDAAQAAFDTWVADHPTFDPDDQSEWGM